MLISGFGRRGHAVGDIPGVRFKVVKVAGFCAARPIAIALAIAMGMVNSCFCQFPCSFRNVLDILRIQNNAFGLILF